MSPQELDQLTASQVQTHLKARWKQQELSKESSATERVADEDIPLAGMARALVIRHLATLQRSIAQLQAFPSPEFYQKYL